MLCSCLAPQPNAFWENGHENGHTCIFRLFRRPQASTPARASGTRVPARRLPRPCIALTRRGKQPVLSTRARVIVDKALLLAAKGPQPLHRVSPMQHGFERIVSPVEGMASLSAFATLLLSYTSKNQAPLRRSAGVM